MIDIKLVKPSTIIKYINAGKDVSLWAAGFKLGVGYGYKTQNVYFDFFKPAKVNITLVDNPYYRNNKRSAWDLAFEYNGIEYRRWRMNESGIKFFRDEFSANAYIIRYYNENVKSKLKYIDSFVDAALDNISVTNPDKALKLL